MRGAGLQGVTCNRLVRTTVAEKADAELLVTVEAAVGERITRYEAACPSLPLPKRWASPAAKLRSTSAANTRSRAQCCSPARAGKSNTTPPRKPRALHGGTGSRSARYVTRLKALPGTPVFVGSGFTRTRQLGTGPAQVARPRLGARALAKARSGIGTRSSWAPKSSL